MKDSLKLLGASPSSVLQNDAAARVRETGYEVTDFAGLFTVPKAKFLVTIGSSAQFHIEDNIRVRSAGTLAVTSGKVSVSDPCDSAFFDRTILPVAAELPLGKHDVYVAHEQDDLLAVVVVFAGEREVVGWLPALLGDPAPPMPTPPTFPMAPVRFSLGLADAALMDEILRNVLVEVDDTALAAFGTQRADARPALAPDGKYPAVERVRSDFAGPRPKLLANHGGLVAFRCDRAPASWLGVDSAGEARALAFDFGSLRRWEAESSLVSAPGLLLDRASLTARFRAAGFAVAEAAALASSLLSRIRACGADVWTFTPTDADRTIFDMPVALRAVSRVEAATRHDMQAATTKRTSAGTAAAPSRGGILAQSLDELELSVFAHNVLQELNVANLGDLVAMTEGELSSAIQKRVGKERSRRYMREIKDILADNALSLRPE